MNDSSWQFRTAVLDHFGVPTNIVLLTIWVVGLALSLPAQSSSQRKQANDELTLFGQVVDALGNPVDQASVKLKLRDGTQMSAATDQSGSFTFKNLHTGSYGLSAEKFGMQSGTTPVTLTETPARMVQIALPPPPNRITGSRASQSEDAMVFSDKPTFTVAGVTDWTAVGGHGSDVTLRTSEDLAREMILLKTETKKIGAVKGENKGGESLDEVKLRAAVTADPRSYLAVRNLGNYYLRAERYQLAAPLLKSASDLSQGKATDEFNLALACEGTGDIQQARRHVEHALAQDDVADFHRLSGELNEKLGDPLAAVQEEELAVRMDPTEENYFVWGSELLLHRAIWQAAEVFATGAKVHPLSARLKTGWGSALFAGARYDDASVRLCEASDLDQADPEPYLFLGKVALASPTSLPCVQQRLARFVQLRPNDAHANYYYAMLLLKKSSTPDLQWIESLLQRAIRSDPRYSEAYLQLGVISFKRQAYSEAIGYFAKAVEADPQQAEPHYRLGVLYDRTGKLQQAQQEFQLHDQLVQAQADAVEKERRKVKQFLIVLQGKSANSAKP